MMAVVSQSLGLMDVSVRRSNASLIKELNAAQTKLESNPSQENATYMKSVCKKLLAVTNTTLTN